MHCSILFLHAADPHPVQVEPAILKAASSDVIDWQKPAPLTELVFSVADPTDFLHKIELLSSEKSSGKLQLA